MNEWMNENEAIACTVQHRKLQSYNNRPCGASALMLFQSSTTVQYLPAIQKSLQKVVNPHTTRLCKRIQAGNLSPFGGLWGESGTLQAAPTWKEREKKESVCLITTTASLSLSLLDCALWHVLAEVRPQLGRWRKMQKKSLKRLAQNWAAKITVKSPKFHSRIHFFQFKIALLYLYNMYKVFLLQTLQTPLSFTPPASSKSASVLAVVKIADWGERDEGMRGKKEIKRGSQVQTEIERADKWRKKGRKEREREQATSGVCVCVIET